MKQSMLLTGAVCMVAQSLLVAAQPGWWNAPGTDVYDDAANHSTSENYAPANIGQLKNMAKNAKLYLEAELPGGAGLNIKEKVDSFIIQSVDNYAPANLGQLKAVAKPFYDRLIEMGFDTTQSLRDHGAQTWSQVYPWDSATLTIENYALTNIGQLKWVFSFDLTGFTVVDGESDGMADAWESHYGVSDPNADPDLDGLTNLDEYLLGSDPNDYYSQGAETIIPRLAIYGGNGRFTPYGQYSAEPIVFKVMNAQTGEALINAPVTLDVTGPGQVAPSQQAAAVNSMTQKSDSQGLVKVYFVAPNAP